MGPVVEAVLPVVGATLEQYFASVDPVLYVLLNRWRPSKVLLPKAVRTASLAVGTMVPDSSQRRAWIALDWLVRVYTSTWLSALGHEELAGHVRGLEAVRERASLARAGTALSQLGDALGERWREARQAAIPQGTGPEEDRLNAKVVALVGEIDRREACRSALPWQALGEAVTSDLRYSITQILIASLGLRMIPDREQPLPFFRRTLVRSVLARLEDLKLPLLKRLVRP